MPALPPPNFENTTTLADTTEDSATAALFRAAIGPVNTAYYLDRFTRFDSADRTSASWNWGAALLTLNWMVYRQLWSAALVYGGLVVGLGLLLLGIGRLVLQIPPDTEMGLALALLLAAVALPGLYGNALYYNHCRKRMAYALANHDTLPDACAKLLRQASSRQRLAWLVLANAVVLGAAVAGYLHLPKGPLTPPITPPISPPIAATPPALALPPAIVASAPEPAHAASAPELAASAPMVVASAPAAPASAVVLNMRPESTDKMAEPAPPPVVPPEIKVTPPAPTKAVIKPVAKPVAKPVTKAAVKPAAKPAEKPATKAAPAVAHNYYVNVGLFADDNNARNAYVKLSDAGLPATQQVLNTKKGPMTRVRVGPYDNEHEAERASGRIRALGLDAQITKP